jgi:membrane-bound lytic murein transglycosylase MltF
MSFTSLGDSSVEDYRAIYKEGERFILACYNMGHCDSITDARKELWRRKISKCWWTIHLYVPCHQQRKHLMRIVGGHICSWSYGTVALTLTHGNWTI